MVDVQERIELPMRHKSKTPMYKGETSKNKRKFVKKYQDYYNTLLAYETCQNKPIVMPVSVCVEVWTKEQILKYEMEKSAMEVAKKDG